MIKIDIMIFSISLFIGLFLVYITAPVPNIIFKYPTLNNINGLGLGRDNGSIDRVWKKEIPANNPKNCCRPGNELYNYYHTMDYNLRNDGRYTTPGSGSVFGDTNYSQCL